jgi:predicted dehydrogenase
MRHQVTAGEPVRVAVVGGGLVGSVVHLPHLVEMPERFDIVGLAEPRPSTRRRLARRFGIEVAAATHEELLERARPDAVIVCSPNATHATVALDALHAGAHVLIEKPLCLTLADADRIIAARDRTELVVQVGYMKRFDPAYEAMLEDLPRRDQLWQISTMTYDPVLAPWFAGEGGQGAAAVGVAAGDAVLARRTAEQVAEAVGSDAASEVVAFANGFLGALVHDVNAVLGVLDRLGLEPPERIVDAYSTRFGALCGGAIALEGGGRWTMSWMELAGLGDFREEICVYAADGVRRLVFPAPYIRHGPTVYERGFGVDGAHRTASYRSWHESYARQLVHFHDCITAGAPCRTPPEQGRRDIALLTDLFRAGRGVTA